MAADICNFCCSKGIDASSTGATIEFRKSLFTGEQRIMEEIKQDQGAQPCATAVTIPPGYEYMTVGEMPKEFTHGVLMRAFTDYSVAVGLERSGSYFPVGTGVLVRRGGHFGILTAYHCLYACSPEVRLGSQNTTQPNACRVCPLCPPIIHRRRRRVGNCETRVSRKRLALL